MVLHELEAMVKEWIKEVILSKVRGMNIIIYIEKGKPIYTALVLRLCCPGLPQSNPDFETPSFAEHMVQQKPCQIVSKDANVSHFFLFLIRMLLSSNCCSGNTSTDCLLSYVYRSLLVHYRTSSVPVHIGV